MAKPTSKKRIQALHRAAQEYRRYGCHDIAELHEEEYIPAAEEGDRSTTLRLGRAFREHDAVCPRVQELRLTERGRVDFYR